MVNFESEVHGVFTPVIPAAAQAGARLFMQGRRVRGRARQGLIPDFKVALPSLVDGAAATDVLAELKVLRCGSTARWPVGVQTENYDHKLRHYYVTTAPEAECDIRVLPEYPHPSMVMSKWLKSEGNRRSAPALELTFS